MSAWVDDGGELEQAVPLENKQKFMCAFHTAATRREVNITSQLLIGRLLKRTRRRDFFAYVVGAGSGGNRRIGPVSQGKYGNKKD